MVGVIVNKCSFSVCLLGWVILYARTVNGVCMNGFAVVEALWWCTGIAGIIKHISFARFRYIV